VRRASGERGHDERFLGRASRVCTPVERIGAIGVTGGLAAGAPDCRWDFGRGRRVVQKGKQRGRKTELRPHPAVSRGAAGVAIGGKTHGRAEGRRLWPPLFPGVSRTRYVRERKLGDGTWPWGKKPGAWGQGSTADSHPGR